MGCVGSAPPGPAGRAAASLRTPGCTELLLRDAPLDERAVTQLSRALPSASSLRSLTIAHSFLEDLPGQRLLYAVSREARLTEVDLSGNHLDDCACAELGKLLDLSCGELQRLALYDNSLSGGNLAKLAEPLARCTALRLLTLGYNSLGDKGSVVLAASLEGSASLEQLDLSRCGLGESGLQRISEALLKSTSLKNLNISRNRLTSASAAAIVNAVLGSAPISQLEVRSCGSAVCELAGAMSAVSTLRHVGMAENELSAVSIGPIGLALSLADCPLHSLDLSVNCLSDLGGGLFAEALFTNGSLEELRLSRNGIGSSGATRLADVLRENRTLKSLDLSKNAMDTETMKKFVAALEQNHTVEELDLDFEDSEKESAELSSIARRLQANKERNRAAGT